MNKYKLEYAVDFSNQIIIEVQDAKDLDDAIRKADKMIYSGEVKDIINSAKVKSSLENFDFLEYID